MFSIDDHGVVDDQADGDGQAAQRHQVQRVAGQVEEDEGDDEAQRDRQRRDQRGPPALEEQQQDQDAQQAADDDGVADVGDRRAGPAAPGRRPDGSRRRAGRLLAASASTASRSCETASALPPSRRKTVRATASLPLERMAIVRSSCPIVTRPRSRSRIDWPFFWTMTRSSRSSGSVASVSARTWYCSALAIEPADGLEAVFLAEPVGHVGDRQAGGHQGLRVDLDQDLADVAPLDGDVGDVGDAADPGPQVVVGVVVKRRRVSAAGDDERDDREDRRRLPLGDRWSCPAGSWAPTSAIRARMSLSAWIMSVPGAKSISSSRPPRTDFERTRIDAQHDADRLLDRPRDGHLDVLDGQARRLRDDDDPREGDLGVDAAGHAEHRDDAEGGQQARGQDDQPEVRPGQGDEVDPARRRARVAAGSPAPGSGSSSRLGLLAGSPWCSSPFSGAAFSSPFSGAALVSSSFSEAVLTGVPSGRL